MAVAMPSTAMSVRDGDSDDRSEEEGSESNGRSDAGGASAFAVAATAGVSGVFGGGFTCGVGARFIGDHQLVLCTDHPDRENCGKAFFYGDHLRTPH